MGLADFADPAAAFGGDLVSAGLSYVGQQQTNAANISAAQGLQQQNEQFQEYMSDTAHQREVADLKAAGLNPILSATGGGGAGGGSAGQAAPEITSPAEAVGSSAKAMASSLADLRSTDAETKVKLNQSKLLEAQTAGAKSDALLKAVDAKRAYSEGEGFKYLNQGVDWLEKKLGYQPSLKKMDSPKKSGKPLSEYNSDGVSGDGRIDPRRKP